MLLYRLCCKYSTIPSGPNPRSAPRPRSENGKSCFILSALSFRSVLVGTKANEAIALKPHCLILAFCNTFDLHIPPPKDHQILWVHEGECVPRRVPISASGIYATVIHHNDRQAVGWGSGRGCGLVYDGYGIAQLIVMVRIIP